MINKSLILRAFKYLSNNKVNTSEIIVTGESGMVMHDVTRNCQVLELAILCPTVYNAVTGLLRAGKEDLTDDGYVCYTGTLIKGLDLSISDRHNGKTVKVDDINVVDLKDLEASIHSAKGKQRLQDYIKCERNEEDDVEQLRAFYRGVEDLTKIRIQNGQRVLACFKNKLGVTPSEDEEKIAKALKLIEAEHKMLTDGVVKLTKTSFRKMHMTHSDKTKYIDSYSEMMMVTTYLNIRDEEEKAVKRLTNLLEGIPIYDKFLVYVRGCGPKMSAAIISELNINAARYPSSFWKYCGLDVTVDPETGENVGRRNWTRLMEDAEFIDFEGKLTKTKNLGYNARLKSKLVFVMAECMIKNGGYYRDEVYYPYKNRLENRPDLKDQFDEDGKVTKSFKAKRNKMAMRYMVKQFLCDLFLYWKKLSGGEIVKPYGVAKLGMAEHSRKTFLECLEMAKERGGKPEDYIGVKTKVA